MFFFCCDWKISCIYKDREDLFKFKNICITVYISNRKRRVIEAHDEKDFMDANLSEKKYSKGIKDVVCRTVKK